MAGSLGWDHRDPFDRILAAQAIGEAAILVTKDAIFDDESLVQGNAIEPSGGAEYCYFMLSRVRLRHGPTPYREAVETRLRDRGYTIVDTESDEADCFVVYVETDACWGKAADAARSQPTVVVLPELDINLYVRALSLGAGTVHVDTSSAIIVDVIAATISGEALLPLTVTQALATYNPPGPDELHAIDLNLTENKIATGLMAGKSVSTLAGELNYSDRTIRRKVQGLFLKLGVTNRESAIDALRARGFAT